MYWANSIYIKKLVVIGVLKMVYKYPLNLNRGPHELYGSLWSMGVINQQRTLCPVGVMGCDMSHPVDQSHGSIPSLQEIQISISLAANGKLKEPIWRLCALAFLNTPVGFWKTAIVRNGQLCAPELSRAVFQFGFSTGH